MPLLKGKYAKVVVVGDDEHHVLHARLERLERMADRSAQLAAIVLHPADSFLGNHNRALAIDGQKAHGCIM